MTPKAIVVHVSASIWGDAKEITRWHKARGFDTIGYHRVILNGFTSYNSKYNPGLDGHISMGRSDSLAGAHCREGGMNQVSLGVCLVGNPGWTPEGPEYMKAGPLWRTAKRPYVTKRQYASLVSSLATLCERHGIDPKGTFEHQGRRVHTISQHSDHDPKKPLCASLDVGILRKAVAEEMEKRLARRRRS